MRVHVQNHFTLVLKVRSALNTLFLTVHDSLSSIIFPIACSLWLRTSYVHTSFILRFVVKYAQVRITRDALPRHLDGVRLPRSSRQRRTPPRVDRSLPGVVGDEGTAVLARPLAVSRRQRPETSPEACGRRSNSSTFTLLLSTPHSAAQHLGVPTGDRLANVLVVQVGEGPANR